jgi:hypothetical protein
MSLVQSASVAGSSVSAANALVFASMNDGSSSS